MNTNNDLRLTMCESALAVLDSKARYTTMLFFRACIKGLHPMNGDTLQNVWIKSVVKDLSEDGLIETDGSLVKITMKGRRVIYNGGYRKMQEREMNKDIRDAYVLLLTSISTICTLFATIFSSIEATKGNTAYTIVAVSMSLVLGGTITSLWRNRHAIRRLLAL